jgi:hypothetical protein
MVLVFFLYISLALLIYFYFIAEPKDVGLKINETDIQTTFESEIENKDDDTF